MPTVLRSSFRLANLPPVGSHKRSGKETASVSSPSSKKTRNHASSTSSLSPPSFTSPTAAGAGDPLSAEGSPESSDSSDSHQPEPAPAVPQYQVFGPDPLTFDDPTIYHIREITPGMTCDEKREI